MAATERRGGRADYRAIARAIAVGANHLLPPGFEATELAGDIGVAIRGEFVGAAGVGSILSDREGPLTAADISGVAETVLNYLQDVVSEDTARPWPPVEGKERGYMAAYRASWGSGRLRMWFEADGQPVTTITDVLLELERAAEQAAAPDGGRGALNERE